MDFISHFTILFCTYDIMYFLRPHIRYVSKLSEAVTRSNIRYFVKCYMYVDRKVDIKSLFSSITIKFRVNTILGHCFITFHICTMEDTRQVFEIYPLNPLSMVTPNTVRVNFDDASPI